MAEQQVPNDVALRSLAVRYPYAPRAPGFGSCEVDVEVLAPRATQEESQRAPIIERYRFCVTWSPQNLVLRRDEMGIDLSITQTTLSAWDGEKWTIWNPDHHEFRLLSEPLGALETDCLSLFCGYDGPTPSGYRSLAAIVASGEIVALRDTASHYSTDLWVDPGERTSFVRFSTRKRQSPAPAIEELLVEIGKARRVPGDPIAMRIHYHVHEWTTDDNGLKPRVAFRDTLIKRANGQEMFGRSVLKRAVCTCTSDLVTPALSPGIVVRDERADVIYRQGGLTGALFGQDISMDDSSGFNPLRSFAVVSPLSTQWSPQLSSQLVIVIASILIGIGSGGIVRAMSGRRSFVPAKTCTKQRMYAGLPVGILAAAVAYAGISQIADAKTDVPINVVRGVSGPFEGEVRVELATVELPASGAADAQFCISLRNASTESVKIDKVTATCGCTTATANRTQVAPGEELLLKGAVRFTSQGVRSESLYIGCGTAGVAQVMITARATARCEIRVLQSSLPLSTRGTGVIDLMAIVDAQSESPPPHIVIKTPMHIRAQAEGWELIRTSIENEGFPSIWRARVDVTAERASIEPGEVILVTDGSVVLGSVELTGRPWMRALDDVRRGRLRLPVTNAATADRGSVKQ